MTAHTDVRVGPSSSSAFLNLPPITVASGLVVPTLNITGALKWAPPGLTPGADPTKAASYPGYVHVTASGGAQSLTLDNNTDYFITLGAVSWNQTTTVGSRTQFQIKGGRNVVIVGGSIHTNITNAIDDAVAILIDGGNAAGVVHIEGVDIISANGITPRTPRGVQIQNCRIKTYVFQDNINLHGVHPDIIQIWDQGTGASRIPFVRLHKVSAWSDMTFFSDFTPDDGSQTPGQWEMHQVDIHALAPQSGSVNPSAANGAPLICENFWMGNPSFCKFSGDELYFELGYASSTNRDDLGDDCRQYGTQFTPAAARYEIKRNGSVIFTSPSNPTNGAADGINTAGNTQGDSIVYIDNANLTWSWSCHIAPKTTGGADANGNYCAVGVPGPNYVSPGYQ